MFCLLSTQSYFLSHMKDKVSQEGGNRTPPRKTHSKRKINTQATAEEWFIIQKHCKEIQELVLKRCTTESLARAWLLSEEIVLVLELVQSQLD